MRCHAGSNPAPGTKEGPPTRGKAETKINNKVMKKNYIQKSDLGEILEELTERALKHSESIEVNMIVRQFCNEEVLDVNVKAKGGFESLASRSYVIIDDIKDSYDVGDDTVSEALARLEQKAKDEAEAAAKAEAEAKANENTSNI